MMAPSHRREVQLAREVLEEFAAGCNWARLAPGQTVGLDELVYGPSIYAPPFRDRLPDGDLGDEYGPCRSEWGDLWTDWHCRLAWDPSVGGHLRHTHHRPLPRRKVARRPISNPAPPQPIPRPDAEEVIAWMALHPDEAAPKEKEVFTLFYINGCSRTRTARIMGVRLDTVRTLLKRLRRRMKA